MQRKDAEHYVYTGRAIWLCHLGGESDQIRLVESNPTNESCAAVAAMDYQRAAATMIRRPEELRHIPVLRPHKALMNRSRGRRRMLQ